MTLSRSRPQEFGSLSNNVFERRTSTGSGLFSFFDGGFALYNSKEAKEYKFYIIKACQEGKYLTSGWRASLNNVAAY